MELWYKSNIPGQNWVFQPIQKFLRSVILYEYHQQRSATVAWQNINRAYPELVSLRKIKMWFAKFKNGEFDLKDKPRSGRPVKMDEDALLTLLKHNRLSPVLKPTHERSLKPTLKLTLNHARIDIQTDSTVLKPTLNCTRTDFRSQTVLSTSNNSQLWQLVAST